ncbi:MAG: dynamin family protein [Myxococcales bacterium]|nr:dynamin family protein [Polyangiaceae bacterium]MDW8250171.1 dynamin family protein [Myxococcales bacterium]
MPTLQEELSDFFGRAIIVARGGAEDRLAAERALAAGDPSLALRYARELLAKVPRSPIGLLLAAEAAERAFLDDQAVLFLSDLAEVVPWAPEVWLRLGRAKLRAGHEAHEVRDALSRAVADPRGGEVAVAAAVLLADLDLAAGDPRRALVWLDRVRDAGDPSVAERRAIALLDLGDTEGALQAASSLAPPEPADGRRALLFGRLAALQGRDAMGYLLRAYILDERGAARALASYLATASPTAVGPAFEVVSSLDGLHAPLFRAALAQARGDLRGSVEALAQAAEQGDTEAARALASQALILQDDVSLRKAHRALAAASLPCPEPEVALLVALDALASADLRGALDALDRAGELPWAVHLRAEIMGRLAPQDGLADVPGVLGELRRAARALDDTAALVATEAIAVEAERPLRVAIMGEFNAGKSTFVNALLGAEIAPTGVLPTTATLHHVVFSPDPFARIQVLRAPERVVPPERLRAALAEVQQNDGVIERVTVGYPLERLRYLELIDTPGFNAPNVDHAASAREALREVHLVLWLLDASQPWKETERAVLAEVREGGVPVQFLVNKLDRVSDEDRARVLAYVQERLHDTGLTSLAPVVAMSSRQALAGRLGDTEALAHSRWAEVEALIEQIAIRAPSLRDLAVRRRVRGLLTPLLARARELAAAELAAARSEAAARGALVQAASLIHRDQTSLALRVGRALDEPRRALLEDLAPLDQSDPAASRSYAASRALQRFTEPLTSILATSLIPSEEHRAVAVEALRPAVSAALQGLVVGLAQPTEIAVLPPERLLEAVALPCAAALQRESMRWAPRSATGAGALALRLAALMDALAPKATHAP